MWTLIIIALLTGQASSTGANGARSGSKYRHRLARF